MMTFRGERHHTYAVPARPKIESATSPALAIAMPWLRRVTNPTTTTKINANPAACTPYRPFPVANAVIWEDMDGAEATNWRDSADPSLTFIPNTSASVGPGFCLRPTAAHVPGHYAPGRASEHTEFQGDRAGKLLNSERRSRSS